MATKKLYLSGLGSLEELDDLAGVPLICRKTPDDEFECTKARGRVQVLGKGIVLTRLLSPAQKAALEKLHAKEASEAQKTVRSEFKKAREACITEGKTGRALRRCIGDKMLASEEFAKIMTPESKERSAKRKAYKEWLARVAKEEAPALAKKKYERRMAGAKKAAATRKGRKRKKRSR